MSRVTNFRTERAQRKEMPDDGSMSLMDHLRELRSRLFKCALAVAAGAVVTFFLYDPIYRFLTEPYCEAVEGTKRSCQLVFFDLVSPFATQLRVAGYGGVILALPVIFFQIWRFIAPGLYRNEKRYAAGFVASSVTLFMLGATLAYFTLPAMFGWLIDQAGTAEVQAKAEDYFRLLSLMVVAFGVGFEFPLLLLVLQVLGIVSPDTLAAYRRHAIVGIVTVVAVITPGGDPISLFALSVPLALFYEASIWGARALIRRRSGDRPKHAAA